MPQVLFVNRYNGDFHFVDVDGRDNTEDGGRISHSDASVLLERIKGGYTHVPAGRYVIVLDLHGVAPNDYFQFTQLVDFDTDDDGYPVPFTVPLVTQDYLDYLKSRDVGINATAAMAVIDYERNNLVWIGNPLSATPWVSNYADVPRVDLADDDMVAIQTLGTRVAMRNQPVHVSSIKVNFQQG